MLENYPLKDAIDLRLAYGMSNRDISSGESLVKSSLPWDLEGFRKLDLDCKMSRTNVGVSRNETRATQDTS